MPIDQTLEHAMQWADEAHKLLQEKPPVDDTLSQALRLIFWQAGQIAKLDHDLPIVRANLAEALAESRKAPPEDAPTAEPAPLHEIKQTKDAKAG